MIGNWNFTYTSNLNLNRLRFCKILSKLIVVILTAKIMLLQHKTQNIGKVFFHFRVYRLNRVRPRVRSRAIPTSQYVNRGY